MLQNWTGTATSVECPILLKEYSSANCVFSILQCQECWFSWVELSGVWLLNKMSLFSHQNDFLTDIWTLITLHFTQSNSHYSDVYLHLGLWKLSGVISIGGVSGIFDPILRLCEIFLQFTSFEYRRTEPMAWSGSALWHTFSRILVWQRMASLTDLTF